MILGKSQVITSYSLLWEQLPILLINHAVIHIWGIFLITSIWNQTYDSRVMGVVFALKVDMYAAVMKYQWYWTVTQSNTLFNELALFELALYAPLVSW